MTDPMLDPGGAVSLLTFDPASWINRKKLLPGILAPF